MRCPLEGQVDQVVQGELSPPRVQVVAGQSPAEDRSYLEVDELRCGELFTVETRASLVAIATVVSQRNHEHAGVNDEHVPTAAHSLMP